MNKYNKRIKSYRRKPTRVIKVKGYKRQLFATPPKDVRTATRVMNIFYLLVNLHDLGYKNEVKDILKMVTDYTKH